jgi:hypothetical protein
METVPISETLSTLFVFMTMGKGHKPSGPETFTANIHYLP